MHTPPYLFFLTLIFVICLWAFCGVCFTISYKVRGKEFHVGIIDEGCFGNPRIFKENMLPVWLMKGRVIMGISSPKGKSNYFAKLFFAKYPNTPRSIFNTLIFDGACKRCKEEGKLLYIYNRKKVFVILHYHHAQPTYGFRQRRYL